MPSQSGREPDGKNSLLGEFLLALARAPEPVQESIVLFGLKQMRPYPGLIEPYPMISHMVSLIESNGGASAGGAGKASGSGKPDDGDI